MGEKISFIDLFGTELELEDEYAREMLVTETGALQEDVAVLEARMDTFTALPTGSTSGDAELMDIRVGADGVTYASAGSAVREQTKAVYDSVTDIETIIGDITEPSGTFKSLTPLKTVTGKYVFENNSYHRVNEVEDTSFGYKVFEIKAGNTYQIYGFGYDRYQFYMALLADNPEVMTNGHYVSNVYENVLCGTDAYPSGHTYHTITKIFEEDGFLFVNYRTAQNEATCGITQLMPKKDPAIEKLETSEPYHGVVIDGVNFYHFVKYGGEYLFRHFKRTGANNLFQWYGIEKGTLTSAGVNIEETVITYDTDIVGPISIFNTAMWPGQYGEWSGGNHSKNIGGTNYPTATQESFKLLVNGEEVTSDGIYYGDVKIITVNSLYFPQSITGADLSTATKAITETREYSLDNQMHVRVKLAFEETTRISLYYGMQAVIREFNNILFVNNELYKTLPNATVFDIPKEENEVILTADTGLRLILNLKRIGLGTFNRNDGATGYGTLPASSNTNKVYYRLIEGASAPSIEPGTMMMWEGDYILDYV